MKKDSPYNYSAKDILNQTRDELLDPEARELAKYVRWENLDGLSKDINDLYPVVVMGEGPPIILLHGFDSCFLEFRRLATFLKSDHKLIIPDLYGFGFTPRHSNSKYGLEMIIYHLNKVMDLFPDIKEFGLIGASMGGGIGLELARKNVSRINKLLLLSPAGVVGEPKKIAKPFDILGVFFLRNKIVRKILCQQSFADPSKGITSEEEQIASIHLNVPGWSNSLEAFARSGGIANCGYPQPEQTMKALWGKEDRILSNKEISASKKILNCRHEEISECGHLPHLDQPEKVFKYWLEQ